MLQRKPVFPNVIEINHQVGHVVGCNVFLIFDRNEWVLIDMGYEEMVDDTIELIRQMDFPFSQCKMLIATHADVDHVQGMSKAKRVLRTQLAAHPKTAAVLNSGDVIQSFAEIHAQGVHLEMPSTNVEQKLQEGDIVRVGDLALHVWWTPGHTDGHLAFQLGRLLLSGDTIYRDGCVGAIDAHHGSNLPQFIGSLKRIRDADIDWVLPSHGPIFRRDPAMLTQTIQRLDTYQHMADFGTCAVDWPLIDQWESELAEGRMPGDDEPNG